MRYIIILLLFVIGCSNKDNNIAGAGGFVLENDVRMWLQNLMVTDSNFFDFDTLYRSRIGVDWAGRIEDLNLSGMELDSIPWQVYKMKGLTHLYLSDNNITFLSPEIAELSVGFFYLDMSHNKLREIPVEITELNYLMYASFTYNEICGEVPAKIVNFIDGANLAGSEELIWRHDGSGLANQICEVTE